MPEVVLTFAICGAVLNRFSGWTDYLPGRNIYWATLAAVAYAWPTLGSSWALMIGISMLTYRLPGWSHSLDMGTVGDTFARDFKVMFLRSLFIFPAFVYSFWLSHDPSVFFLLVIGAIGATLSYALGNHIVNRWLKDPFWVIEPLAGAFLGAAVGQAWVMGH